MNDIDNAINGAKADVLPYESWEKLAGETSLAYAAFCAFRDLGAGRNIRRAVEATEKDKGKLENKYKSWRNWAFQYRWKERAADYDRYLEQLKQTELRKTIEAQGEKHRAVTGKMLDVALKKLDIMNPDELTQGNLTEWVNTAIKSEREAAGIIAPNGKTELSTAGGLKQGELFFVPYFEGL